MKSIMAPMSTRKRSFRFAFSILMSATGSSDPSAGAGGDTVTLVLVSKPILSVLVRSRPLLN